MHHRWTKEIDVCMNSIQALDAACLSHALICLNISKDMLQILTLRRLVQR